MHRGLILYLIIIAHFNAFTQGENPARYRDLLFNDILVDKNIAYQNSLKPGTKNKHHLLDIYQPANDTASMRPLIIWIHGGGFKYGKKSSRGIPVWSKSFAQRGYVCAAINYRSTKKRSLSQFPALVDGCYGAIEDLHLAIAFLKLHSRQFNIDTNRILLAGNSAGGMVALQACYSSFSLLAKKAGRPDSNTMSTLFNPLRIAGVINMWGAIFDLRWLRNAQVPIISIHGSKDRVVAFKSKDNSMFGSYGIHKEADQLHIPNRLKIYEGYGHEIQKYFIPFWAGYPVRKRWLEAGQFAAVFLYETLFTPELNDQRK